MSPGCAIYSINTITLMNATTMHVCYSRAGVINIVYFAVIISACKSLYQLCILFNQTEIRGIKWRKLSANPDYTTVDQLEDPVLVSYSKCIKADILSVWRRVARSSDQPRYTTDQLSYNKELWIFWYGDEPENLSRLISPDLRGTVTLVVSHVYHVNQVKIQYTHKN